MTPSRPLLAALCAVSAAWAGVAAAQTPAPATPAAVDPTESAVVQELEVIGRFPGPRLWTVRRGGAEVVILGGLTPLPHALEWNALRLERAMEGAREVLLPPTGRVGALDALYILFHAGELQLPGGETLERKLGPDAFRRFEAQRLRAKTEQKRYTHLKPAVAAALLNSDVIKAIGFSSAKPGSTVKTLADKRHIRTRSEGGIPVPQGFRALVRLSDGDSAVCVNAVLDELDDLERYGRTLADAWANGDLKVVRAQYVNGGFDRCIAGNPGLKAFSDKLTQDAAAAVGRALDQGGKTVAVIDLKLLLQPNGVLDRLKAQGAEITVPKE